MRCSELTIYHQEQELHAKKTELRSIQNGSSVQKDKKGWGSKLGTRAPFIACGILSHRRLQAAFS
jgi:hypothetical protein